MSEMEVIIGIMASFGAAGGLVVVPVIVAKLWERYVENKGTAVNSGAKFG